MNPIASAALAAWSPPWDLLFAATGAVVLYWRGFAKLRRQLPSRFPAWRRGCFLSGIAVLLGALASPLDAFADGLLQAHMLQHWLLMMVAPPLLWLGAPVVPLMRGLPHGWLRRGLGPFLSWPALRRFVDAGVRPGTALALWIVATLVWHWPGAYQAAVRSRAWHDFEHLSFLIVALLFWYAVALPWPARRPANRAAIAIPLGIAALFNTIFSASFVFSDRVFYPVYAEMPRLFDVDALTDQKLAGAFLWVAGSLPMVVAATLTLIRATDTGDRTRVAAPVDRPGSAGRRIATRLKGIAAAAIGSRRARKSAQIVMGALAIAIVADGLLGPQRPSATNLAGVLPWTYWRGFVVVGLLVAGNLFCAVCPFTLTRALSGPLSRRFAVKLRWPARLRNRWLAVVLFAAYLWSYEVFAIWDRPWWTAWLVVGYFTASFGVEALFGRGTFCKHVCPIGQFHFAASANSPLEVRVLAPEVCTVCSSHDCLRGGPRGPGCATDLFLPVKQGNLDCTFCLDCVRACPNDNVGLQAVTPASSLGPARTPRLDFAALAALFCFGAFANAAAMVAPVAGMPWLPLWLGLCLVAVPAFSLIGCAAVGRFATGGSLPKAKLVAALAPALIPIGFAMWFAHFGFHTWTAMSSLVPAVGRAADDLGFSLPGAAGAGGMAAFDITGVEIGVLGIGLLVSTAVTWRLARRQTTATLSALAVAAPWVLVSALLYGLGVWIFLQPMEMRGMSM